MNTIEQLNQLLSQGLAEEGFSATYKLTPDFFEEDDPIWNMTDTQEVKDLLVETVLSAVDA